MAGISTSRSSMSVPEYNPNAQLGVKSSTLAPTSSKAVHQLLVVQHLQNHYNKIQRVKSHIDNSPPKSLLLSTKVRERMLRESMMRKHAAPKKSARGPTQEQFLDATGDGPPFGTLNGSTGVRPTTSNASLRAHQSVLSTNGGTDLLDGDAVSDGGMVEDRIVLSQKRTQQYSAPPRPPPAAANEDYVPFAQQVSSSEFPTSPMSSQRPPSGVRSSTSSSRKQQLVRSGAAPISHDILDKSRENFTEPGDFKPRTVRYANVQSTLSSSRNYNPPRKRNNSARASSAAGADGVDAEANADSSARPADHNGSVSAEAAPRQSQANGFDVVSKRQTRATVESSRRQPSSSAERPQLALNIPPDPDKLKWLHEQSQMAVMRKRAGAVPYDEQVRGHQQQQRTFGLLERERLSDEESEPRAPPSERTSRTLRMLHNEEEELKYLEFVSDVTNDVLSRGIYTNRALNQVLEYHVLKNKNRLKISRMRAMLEGLREDLGIPANDEDLESGFGYGSTRKFDVVRQMEYLDELPPALGAEPTALTGQYSARSGLGVGGGGGGDGGEGGISSRSSRTRPGGVSYGATAGLTPRSAAGGETIGQQLGRRQAAGRALPQGAASLPAPIANPELHAAPPVDIKALLGLTPASKPELAPTATSSVAQPPTSLPLQQQTVEPAVSLAPARSLPVVLPMSSALMQPTPPSAVVTASTTVTTTTPSAVAVASTPADSRRSSAGPSAAGAGATTTIEQSTYPSSVGLFGLELHPAQLDNMVSTTVPSAPQAAPMRATNGSSPKGPSPTAVSKRASKSSNETSLRLQPQQQADQLGTGTLNSTQQFDDLALTYEKTLRVQEDAADAASVQSASLEFSAASSDADAELGGTKRAAIAAAAGGDARSRRRQNRLETSLGNGTLGSQTATGVTLVKQPTPTDSLIRSPPDSKLLLSDDERGASASVGKSVKFAQNPKILSFEPRSSSASYSGSGSPKDAAFTTGGGAPTLTGMLASFERRAMTGIGSGGGAVGSGAPGLERESSRMSASDMEALDSHQSFTIPSGQDTFHTQQPQVAVGFVGGTAPSLHRRGSRDGSTQQSQPTATPPPLTKQSIPKNVSPKQDEDDTYAEDFEDEDTLK